VRVPTRFAPLVFAALLGGCVTDANMPAGQGTLAFESIDGPPRPVFDTFVAHLDAEAKARNVAIVSRDRAARYRIRAYLAATVTRGKTAVNWVWDVYDADGHRMLRLSGEQPAGRTAKDAWADADERILGRIAEAGMRQLAAFTSNTTVETPATAATAEPAPAAETAEATSPAAAPDVRIVASASAAAFADPAH
jgi:hypothetical protein